MKVKNKAKYYYLPDDTEQFKGENSSEFIELVKQATNNLQQGIIVIDL